MPINNPLAFSTNAVNVFSGDPSLVVPDFDNQLWVATDTYKIYLSVASELVLTNGGGSNSLDLNSILSAIVVQDGAVITTDDSVVWQNTAN